MVRQIGDGAADIGHGGALLRRRQQRPGVIQKIAENHHGAAGKPGVRKGCALGRGIEKNAKYLLHPFQQRPIQMPGKGKGSGGGQFEQRRADFAAGQLQRVHNQRLAVLRQVHFMKIIGAQPPEIPGGNRYSPAVEPVNPPAAHHNLHLRIIVAVKRIGRRQPGLVGPDAAVASGKIVDGKVYAMVAPHLVKPEHPLYAVNDVFNAVMVHGNMVDDVMFYGRGAGSHATASAVMADVVEEAANLGKTLPVSWSAEHQEVAPVASSEKQFLVRVKGGAERETVLAQAFGEGQLVQAEGVTGEIAYLTPVMTEEAFGKAAETVEDVIGRIRVK